MGSSEKGSVHDDVAVDIPERRGLAKIYYHPMTQVCMLGFVCFMCPGLFNALNGLGGGGQLDKSTSANSNVAVYATFAGMAFFAGSVNNVLGSRLTLFLGTLGYSLYIGSYLSLNIHPNSGAFVIAAGAILGICAGLLWSAQGSLMLAYPTESKKGQYIGVFWCIFNLGGVVGASVSLGRNFHSTAGQVDNGTYIGFLVLTIIGCCIPLVMADPKKMVRTDGTRMIAPRHPSWKTEILSLWIALKTDPWILLLFPMFFTSNWFYTWQFNCFNGAYFNIRARALNNLVYWIAQMFGAILIGLLLDTPKLNRRVRAFAGWGVLLIMVFFTHIWAYFYQKDYTRESLPTDPTQLMDIYDSGYPGRIMMYIFMGVLDAMWQTTSYWLMGAMSNDAAKLAHFSGFYKSLQSAGAAGAWRADAVEIPFMNIFISTWVLLVAGLIFALPMLHLRVKNHTELADEVLARMDDDGRVKSVAQVEKEQETNVATA